VSHHNAQVSQCVWRTPARILDPAREVLGQFLDVATDSDNPTKAATFYTEADDGLSQDWGHASVFCNPPWSKTRPIRMWAALAWQYAEDIPEGQLIFVSPASVNSLWFHDFLAAAQAHCFPRGRVKYEMPEGFDQGDGATFDTCVTYFGPHRDTFRRAFREVGWCP